MIGKSLYCQLLIENLGKSGDVLSALKASGYLPDFLLRSIPDLVQMHSAESH